MSVLSVATWTAIGVLVVGSIVVFIWFLKDARTVLRPSRDEAGDEEVALDQRFRP